MQESWDDLTTRMNYSLDWRCATRPRNWTGTSGPLIHWVWKNWSLSWIGNVKVDKISAAQSIRIIYAGVGHTHLNICMSIFDLKTTKKWVSLWVSSASQVSHRSWGQYTQWNHSPCILSMHLSQIALSCFSCFKYTGKGVNFGGPCDMNCAPRGSFWRMRCVDAPAGIRYLDKIRNAIKKEF